MMYIFSRCDRIIYIDFTDPLAFVRFVQNEWNRIVNVRSGKVSHPQRKQLLNDRCINCILLHCSPFTSRAPMYNIMSFEVLAHKTLSVNSASKISNMALL